ncbi:hypothetical protein F4815DRAFT_499828 [Daldinia loculata]|nr:hypothetical protein F4815DRAFT_499828 [Daldinia loculata]
MRLKFILCTENRIIVDREAIDYGLYYLSRLSPRICSKLRNLYVHLYIYDSSSTHLNLTSPFTLKRGCISAWQTAATHLLTYTKPETLDLHLICDTGSDEKTRVVLQPLNNNLGILADCHIRLHPLRDSSLYTAAQETALRAKGLDPDLRKKPFQFMKLPPELRLRVLKHTDLVTPCNEVQWSPNTGFHVIRFGIGSYCCNDENYLTTSNFHASQFWSCDPSYLDATDSFCSARHSSYSSSCQCWIPPKALMLVNQSMYAYAIETLYSYNRVIIMSDPNIFYSNIGSQDLRRRLDVSRFFTRHMWPRILSHLRSVELVFPGFSAGDFYPKPTDPICADWHFAIDNLRAHANLNAMTLIIHMRLWFGPTDSYVRAIDNRNPFAHYLLRCHGEPALALKVHKAFLKPLKALRDGGLQRLFVFLEWDWHWSPSRGCAPHCRGYRDDLNNSVDDMEVNLEKEVMGDEYDSCTVGKMKEYPSQWMLMAE